MNKLLFHEGGQPLTLNDLDFLQESIAQSLSHLTSILPEGFYGSYQSYPRQHLQEYISWTQGVVIIGGKVALLPAGELTYDRGKTCYVYIEEQEGEERTFQDGSIHHTHLIERAVVTTEKPTVPSLILTKSPDKGVRIDEYKVGAITATSKRTPGRTVSIGACVFFKLSGINVQFVAGSIFHPDETLMIEEGSGRAIGIYANTDEEELMERLEGGSFVSGYSVPIGASIHLKQGKVYLLDAKGNYIDRDISTGIRFFYAKSLYNKNDLL